MVKTFKIYTDNTTVYKSINSPMIKKVLLNYIIDGKEVNANEWNKEINTEEELRQFALTKEKSLI